MPSTGEGADHIALEQVGIDFTEGWTLADTECAYRAWNLYVQARRGRDTPKRPLADLLIGAFACRHGLTIDYARIAPLMFR